MSRLLSLILLLFGVVLFFVGQWIAFEIYASIKLSRISQNTAQFINELYHGKSLIRINIPDENIFLLRAQDGKVISTDNAIKPVKFDEFLATSYNSGGAQVYVYTKNVSFSEYLGTFFEKPFAVSISASGAILFFLGLALLFKEGKAIQRDQTKMETTPQKSEGQVDEDLMKGIKALRVALAMGGVIPKESLSEAKRILDYIIKRMEGRT